MIGFTNNNQQKQSLASLLGFEAKHGWIQFQAWWARRPRGQRNRAGREFARLSVLWGSRSAWLEHGAGGEALARPFRGLRVA